MEKGGGAGLRTGRRSCADEGGRKEQVHVRRTLGRAWRGRDSERDSCRRMRDEVDSERWRQRTTCERSDMAPTDTAARPPARNRILSTRRRISPLRAHPPTQAIRAPLLRYTAPRGPARPDQRAGQAGRSGRCQGDKAGISARGQLHIGLSCRPRTSVKLTPQSVVLENLSHGFTHASVLDAKLGTMLHEPSAAPEKRERMEKQARETTTRETGLRLTGCQVSVWRGVGCDSACGEAF
jgi:hypothetical protein